jgi:hypothetical protein
MRLSSVIGDRVGFSAASASFSADLSDEKSRRSVGEVVEGRSVPFALSGWWSAVTGGPNIDGLVTLSFMGAATAAASRLVSSGRLIAEALWLGGGVMAILNSSCALDGSCSSLPFAASAAARRVWAAAGFGARCGAPIDGAARALPRAGGGLLAVLMDHLRAATRLY